MAGNDRTGDEGGTAPAPNLNEDGTADTAAADDERPAGTLNRSATSPSAPTPKQIEQADLEQLREDGTISEDFMQVLLDMQSEERVDALSRATGGGLGATAAQPASPAPEED